LLASDALLLGDTRSNLVLSMVALGTLNRREGGWRGDEGSVVYALKRVEGNSH